MDKAQIHEAVHKTAHYLPNMLTTPTNIGIGYFERLGYHRFFITIEDADTGEQIERRQTYQKTESLIQLIHNIIILAVPPSDLLETIDFTFAESDGTEIFGSTVAQVLSQRILRAEQETDAIHDLARRLHEVLTKRFNEGELRDLCFTSKINYDTLGGESARDKARELILHCIRHECVGELNEAIKRLRPDILLP